MFSYSKFLSELEKEIDYIHSEVLKDYNRDIQFYRDAICQCNPLDVDALSRFSKEMNSLLEGVKGFNEDKQYTLKFFENPEAKLFVRYEYDSNEPIDLLFVMAMITRFVDDAISTSIQSLNCDYWMVEDDEFFGKVIQRSFI